MPQLPLLEAAAVSAQVELKPSWRGWIHAGTFPVAIAAGIVLIVLSHGAAAKWAAAVFMATSVLLFGNSALYHRFSWGPKTKAVLKRIDHANIMLLIAGTYTPLAVLALPPDKGAVLLILVIVGGLLDTGGAVCYALKKPNPWPGHFGFHEIFHVCTVLAFLCHWTACLLIALDPVVPSLGAS